MFDVVLPRLIPQALPTLFNGASEVWSYDSGAEVKDDSELSSDVSHHHLHSDVTVTLHDSSFDCSENIGNLSFIYHVLLNQFITCQS